MRNIKSILILVSLFTIFSIFIGTSSAVNSKNIDQSFINNNYDSPTMIATVAETSVNTPISEIWLFILVFILSFIFSYLKCENYGCSIKYGPLIALLWQLFIIAYTTVVLMMPTFLPEFEMLTAINLIIMTIIPGMIIGLFGSLIAVGLKKILKNRSD